MSFLVATVQPSAVALAAPATPKAVPSAAAPPVLRPYDASDDALLWELYRLGRAHEVAAWADAAATAFLQMQWRIERRARAMHHPRADHAIVMVGGASVGRLLVDRAPDYVELVDIALLPSAQGRGVGSALLADLVTESTGRAVPLRLSVVRGNRAERLYRRFGFVTTGEDAARIHMTCDPRIGDSAPPGPKPKPTHGD